MIARDSHLTKRVEGLRMRRGWSGAPIVPHLKYYFWQQRLFDVTVSYRWVRICLFFINFPQYTYCYGTRVVANSSAGKDCTRVVSQRIDFFGSLDIFQNTVTFIKNVFENIVFLNKTRTVLLFTVMCVL